MKLYLGGNGPNLLLKQGTSLYWDPISAAYAGKTNVVDEFFLPKEFVLHIKNAEYLLLQDITPERIRYNIIRECGKTWLFPKKGLIGRIQELLQKPL